MAAVHLGLAVDRLVRCTVRGLLLEHNIPDLAVTALLEGITFIQYIRLGNLRVLRDDPLNRGRYANVISLPLIARPVAGGIRERRREAHRDCG